MVTLKSPARPSSAIKEYGYDPSSRTLAIRFTGGRRHDYADVPPETAEAFDNHESAGRAYNTLIAGKFTAQRYDDDQDTAPTDPAPPL